MSKSFGGTLANDAISIQVARGSITGLIGPNGSGKTTLFNCISGFHAVDAGSVRFDGREISGLDAAQIARLGLVRTFQQTQIFERMTCMQNMQVAVSHSGERWPALFAAVPTELDGRARGLLEFAGLQAKADLPAGELSFGQQKLLEFAMALMSDPKMLLLDEPSAGINPGQLNALVDLLKRACSSLGITLLVIEHNMRVMESLAERIYCLAHGQLLAAGSLVEMRADPRVIEAYLGVR